MSRVTRGVVAAAFVALLVSTSCGSVAGTDATVAPAPAATVRAAETPAATATTHSAAAAVSPSPTHAAVTSAPTTVPTQVPVTATATPIPTQPPTPRPTAAPTVAPAPPAASTCGAAANPWGYTFCAGQVISAPPSNFCSYFHCIASFWNGRGYVMECTDTAFSKSGGISGSCSQHGGNYRALYAP